jgi:NADH-quinone oxidoreductase subunit G
MSDDIVNIEVDGKPVEARKGQMIIEATDAIGTYIPRFCYHEKLSIAANCRMCLVEVEKAPKPLPACATPITEGMKVFTRSPYAIAAQKATMEFLLINHPLDCPICDQGGECELQDLAVGYGRDVSRYNDGKRVVKDKNIGPLVSTDMTRCIHCTRCVRFGQEIAGIPQLGTTERGENMKIGTYIEQSVDHELSMGDDAESHRIAARLRRFEHVRARASRHGETHRAAREREHQRDLARGSGPLQLRSNLQRRPPDHAPHQERRRMA